MEIGRRDLLGAGLAYVSLAALVRAYGVARPAGANEISVSDRWHSLTRSLLHQAVRARNRLDRHRVERIIHEHAGAQGCSSRPVIKWMRDPAEAFDHLRRQGLRDLLQMQTTAFWHCARSTLTADDHAFERSFEIRWLAAEALRMDDAERALMAPKLLAKRKAALMSASAEATFEARAIAAQIGWLETSIPAAAVEALYQIEILLSQGFSEASKPIYHQLRLLEAHGYGLLATWETPTELVCVPRTVAV